MPGNNHVFRYVINQLTQSVKVAIFCFRWPVQIIDQQVEPQHRPKRVCSDIQFTYSTANVKHVIIVFISCDKSNFYFRYSLPFRWSNMDEDSRRSERIKETGAHLSWKESSWIGVIISYKSMAARDQPSRIRINEKRRRMRNIPLWTDIVCRQICVQMASFFFFSASNCFFLSFAHPCLELISAHSLRREHATHSITAFSFCYYVNYGTWCECNAQQNVFRLIVYEWELMQI